MITPLTALGCAALLATPALAQDLPKAGELLERAVEAAGGRTALEGIETVSFDAEMTMMGEVGARLTCVTAPDGRLYVRGSEMEGGSTFEGGFDGTVGWGREDGGPWELRTGDDMMMFQVMVANQFMVLRLGEWFEGMETLERGVFHGIDAYRVEFRDDDHDILDEGEDLFGWFAADSGLLLGISDEAELSGGMRFDDHEENGPMKIARTVRVQIFEGAEMLVQLTGIKIDAADVSTLDMPSEVRELVGNRDGGGG